MTPQTLAINNILSLLTVGINILTVVIVLALLTSDNINSKKLLTFLKKNSYRLAFLFSAGAMLGSLVYSQFVGFEPCVLCWWQRIFLFPIAILLLIALIKKEKVLTDYILGLSVVGGLIALYQYAVTQLGAPSLTECTSAAGDCSITYFVNFGYVTIPFMSLSVFVLILFIMLLERKLN